MLSLFKAGVYLISLFSTLAVPISAVTAVKARVSVASASVSLLITSMVVSGASSLIVAVSGCATGASFTGVTLMVSVPAAVSVPSLRI